MCVSGGGVSLGDKKGSVAYPVSTSTVKIYLLESFINYYLEVMPS